MASTKVKEPIEVTIAKMRAEADRKWSAQSGEDGKIRLPNFTAFDFQSSDSNGQLELYKLAGQFNLVMEKIAQAFPEKFERKS